VTRETIVAALHAHPDLSDRQIAKLLKHRWWSEVRDVRQSMTRATAAVAAPVVAILPVRRKAHWEEVSEALARLIRRERDEVEKYLLRLALLRVRYSPWRKVR
jgi:DNA-binding NtrC family response regulator